MTGKLPINIDHLLRQRTIEGERIEYKAGWNPKSVLHTICAFANDFHNLGGGYVVLGVEEKNGRPTAATQGHRRRAYRRCAEGIAESGAFRYGAPLPSTHCQLQRGRQGRLSCCGHPAGKTRPYKAKVNLTTKRPEWAYFIRKHSSTVRAKGGDERELLGLAATVPFDDRYHQASLDGRSVPSTD